MILCIDGYFFLHRARSGFNKGDYPVCFNFFRGLRAIVDQFKPNRVYFVIEGRPVRRLQKFPDYKGNRAVDPNNVKKLTELDSFHRQKDLILDLLQTFPISVMRHPEHEGDDVIYNLLNHSSTATPWTVVSSDSDFTQLLGDFPNVRVYNPITKSYFEKPDYDYVMWKSLKGDASDNIPGIPGIGPVKATQLMNDEELLRSFFKENPGAEDVWAHNFDLIKFLDFSDHELSRIESYSPVQKDWSRLHQAFEEWKFQSLLKPDAWDKFIGTFEPLWGN